MPSVGFELTIAAGERPQTYALDRAATGPAPNYWFTYLLHGAESFREAIRVCS